MQQGEVNVPGLGNFSQARVSSHYDEGSNEYHPPYHQVQFTEQVNNDDGRLAEYIASKKGISLASAKYFIEKYVTGLQQDVHKNEIALAGLGWFYMDQSQLLFRAADKVPGDPAFYGLPSVKINKLKHAELVEEVYVPQPEVAPEPEPVEQEEAQPIAENEEEYQPEEEEYERPRRTGWLIFALIVIIAAGVYGLYRYNPAVFERFTAKPKEKAVPKTIDTPVTDSTDVKPVVAVFDSTKTRYEVIVSAVEKIETADVIIKNLKTLDVDAHVVPDDPGRNFKVTVGTYTTRTDAEAARKNLAAAGKIPKDAYTLEIKPGK